MEAGSTRKIDPSTLVSLAFFRDLSDGVLKPLISKLFSKTFPPRSTLMALEQPGEAVYFILSGTVRIHIERSDGEDVVIAILGPGEIVGEMSLLDGRGRSPVSRLCRRQSVCGWMG